MYWHRLTKEDLTGRTFATENAVVNSILQCSFGSAAFTILLNELKETKKQYSYNKITIPVAEARLYIMRKRLAGVYPEDFPAGLGRYSLQLMNEEFLRTGRLEAYSKEQHEEDLLTLSVMPDAPEASALQVGDVFDTKSKTIEFFIDRIPVGTKYKDMWRYVNDNFARFEAHKPIGKHNVWRCTEVLQ